MTARDRAMRPAARLHVEADLAPGRLLRLDAARAHYLKTVLRLGPGSPIALFNGRDGEWLARIEGFGRGWGEVGVERRTHAQAAEADLWLLFAPIRRARAELVAEKATELGVSALQPVLTRHGTAPPPNPARLRAIAVEAAEQSERLSVPAILEPARLDRRLADWPAERRLLVCAEAGAARPIAAVLLEAAGAAERPWAVLVGPEGGFARDELDALGNLPFVTAVGLGPRLLRAETAALAALACWQAILGDREARPPLRTFS